MKKILFLEPYFDPEITADTHLENDLIDTLNKAGIVIHVITPVPTRGVDSETIERYKRIRHEERNNGMLIIDRFWAPQEKQKTFLRFARYFFCVIVQYFKSIKVIDADAIYGISTPPIQGMMMSWVKKTLRSKTGKDIQSLYYLEDIFPDTLVGAGMTKKGSIIWKIGRKIEDYTYRNADRIVTISEACVENIRRKGVPESKIDMIYNWIDDEEVHYIPRSENKLFDEFNLSRNAFYCVYAGNLGNAQNIHLILDCAKKLDEIQFIIFGKGGEEENLRTRIETENIENLKLLPLQKLERVKEVYSLADIDLVSCKKDFGKSALPSKMWSIMACERPIVASFDLDSDLAGILEKTGCGLTAAADNVEELEKAIKTLYCLKAEDRETMGKKGRDYVHSCRSSSMCTQHFLKIFSQMTDKQ